MKRNEKFLAALSAAVCLCFLAAFCIINFLGFSRFCHPDMYSDTYLSRVMWEAGTIFPDNWIFGNQFYVVTTPVLAALMYGLCGSINLSMILATTVMTILTLVSFWWMVRPFADGQRTLLGMAVLLGCVVGPNIVTTIEGQIFYLMASYYAGYIITLFVVFGDYLRALKRVPGRGYFSFALAVALSFCTGMQSLRQTAVMILPLLGVEALRLLQVALTRGESRDWNLGAVLRVGLYTLANLAGRVAIKVLDPNCLTMYGELSFNRLEDLPERFSTCLRAMRSVSGLKYLTAETPLAGIVALALVIAVVAALVVLLLRRKQPNGGEMLMLLFACSVLCVLAVSMTVNIYTRSIYIFPWYPLTALAAMVLADLCRDWRKTAVTLLLLATVMMNLAVSYGPTVSWAMADDESPELQVAQYLVDEGYEIVYGSWGEVAGIAVRTDGQVAAGSWHENTCQVIPYITPTDIFSEEDNARACYLTTGPAVEQALLEHAAAQGAELTLVKHFDGTFYSLYISDRQLMYFP